QRNCIAEQLKPRRIRWLLIIYAEHIEAPLARRWQVAQVLARHIVKLSLLVGIHGGFGGLYVVRGAGFYFNEAEDVFVPGDEINFAAAVRRAKISRDHDIAEAAEIKVSGLFTGASGALMGRNVFRGESFGGEPVEGADGGVGEAAGGHGTTLIGAWD